MPYINFNGKLFRAEQPVLKITNRAFCYGDALFETMRWHDNKILFINDHTERLFYGMRFFKIEIPKKYSVSFFEKYIKELIIKNKIRGDARIRLQVFRNEGGYYTPSDNTPGFSISVEKLQDENYSLNKKGLTIGLYSEISRLKNPVSNFKTSGNIVSVLAGLYAKEKKLDDCFIINIENCITDTIASNIFIVKNNTLFTPPLSDGCVDGVMRKNILQVCKNEKMKVSKKSIRTNDLLSADEIFLTNVIAGLRWVKQFRKRNYTNNFSKYLFTKIIA